MLGESISAVEAERIGFINKIVPEEDLDKAAEDLARKFLDKSSLSVKRSGYFLSIDRCQ